MIPNLIHPVMITIERLGRETMVLDPDTREPIPGPRGATRVSLPAQVCWGSKNSSAEPQGPARHSLGRVTFRYVDLKARGVSLKPGDRIVAIGPSPVSLYITTEEPAAVYPDQAGPTLSRWEFSDRQPARE